MCIGKKNFHEHPTVTWLYLSNLGSVINIQLILICVAVPNVAKANTAWTATAAVVVFRAKIPSNV